jgi:hypothetical protein
MDKPSPPPSEKDHGFSNDEGGPADPAFLTFCTPGSDSETGSET